MIPTVFSDVFLFASLETKSFSIDSKAISKCDLFSTGPLGENIFH